MSDTWNRQLQNHFEEVEKTFSGLTLLFKEDEAIIQGPLEFAATYDGETIEDCYDIEISIPQDYPESLPQIRETGGRIPDDFHQYTNGCLCLAAPLELIKKFKTTPTLMGYINELVIPFLYSFSYHQQKGRMPYGELPHGGEGIIEYYRTLFNVDSDSTAIELLRYLAEGGYAGFGHHDCPCGSKRKLRDCHGPKILELIPHAQNNRYLFFDDFYTVLKSLKNAEEELPDHLFTKKIRRTARERLNL